MVASRSPTNRLLERFYSWSTSTLAPTITFVETQSRDTPEEVKAQLQKIAADPTAVVSIEGFRGEWLEVLAGAQCQFSFIREAASQPDSRTFQGLRIAELQVAGKTLNLVGCHIGVLRLQGLSPRLSMTNTLVAEMDLSASSVLALEWNGGFLGHLKLAERLLGDVVLRNVRLPTSKRPRGLQWLRDARAALTEKNNFLAAAVFHASELALSRPDEPPVNRIASWVYQYGSNFGNSLGRPVGWFAAAWLTIFLVALAVGTEANLENAIGWHHALQGESYSAKGLRAGVYAMQSIFNPLNLIVPRPLVSVTHWVAAVTSFIVGLGGVVAFALFLLSLRRRFKLE